MRRVLHLIGALALAACACVALGAAPASAAARTVMAGSATPAVPTSTVGVMGEQGVRYCVRNYAPNSTVTVTNQLTGATTTIHTNAAGKGCAEVPIKRGCRAITQTIVATGTAPDGSAISSQATVTAPPSPRLCAAAGHKGGSQPGSQSGSLAFTGSSIIIPAILLGIVLIMVGSAVVTAARRKRDLASYGS